MFIIMYYKMHIFFKKNNIFIFYEYCLYTRNICKKYTPLTTYVQGITKIRIQTWGLHINKKIYINIYPQIQLKILITSKNFACNFFNLLDFYL